MNKFREKFLKQISSFRQGGGITKFQNAGKIKVRPILFDPKTGQYLLSNILETDLPDVEQYTPKKPPLDYTEQVSIPTIEEIINFNTPKVDKEGFHLPEYMTGYQGTIDDINHFKYKLGLPIEKDFLEKWEEDQFMHPKYRRKTMYVQ